MELFRNVNIDWLGKKWYLLGLSLIMLLIGGVSVVAKGFKLGIDFSGGTIIYVKFKEKPDLDKIRAAIDKARIGTSTIQRFDREEKNEVLIRLDREIKKEQIEPILRSSFDQDTSNKDLLDLNNLSRERLFSRLNELDPAILKNAKSADEKETFYRNLAQKIADYLKEVGVIRNFDELKKIPEINEGILKTIRQNFYLGSFSVIGLDSVGPTITRDLQRKARNTVLISLGLILVYVGFRFKFEYGLAAVIAVFHDVLVTLGLFSLTNKEISLNVIAAILTLVGYSVNDTVVIFDRVRENIGLMRRENLASIINTSINQTLSRTILTSGFTFLSAVSLLLFGGEVLNGFSFALTVGIITGTYSTLSIASPIVIFWYNFIQKRERR